MARFSLRIRRKGGTDAQPDDVRKLVAQVAREAAPDAVARIRAAWPSRSGRSRDGFAVESRSSGAAIVNRTPYAGHVRRSSGAPVLADTLVPDEYAAAVRTELDRASDRIAEAFLAAALDGVARG